MGYRDDIKGNFTLDKASWTERINADIQLLSSGKVRDILTKMLAFLNDIEDMQIDKALDRYLQSKRNLVENRTKAAKDKFMADNPEAIQMDITPILLEKYDKGLTEAIRQVSSYEQGTISGKVRDSKDKIRNALETQITIRDK